MKFCRFVVEIPTVNPLPHLKINRLKLLSFYLGFNFQVYRAMVTVLYIRINIRIN